MKAEAARPGLPCCAGYQLLELLGKGGGGLVYRARPEAGGAEVALKILPPERLSAAADPARFAREAELVAQAQHPYIVPLLAVGLAGDPPHLVYALMPGGDLAARLARVGRLELEAAAALGARVLAALTHLHGLGILHRDVKPSNVLLDGKGRAFLGDLGLGRSTDSQKLTASGTQLGTFEYMAPEVREGRPATPVSDLWSMAATLVETLTGERPRVTGQGVVMPRGLAPPGFPARLVIELRQHLRSQPDDRPAGPAGLAACLEEIA